MERGRGELEEEEERRGRGIMLYPTDWVRGGTWAARELILAHR